MNPDGNSPRQKPASALIPAGRRIAARARVHLPIVLESLSGTRRGTLRNLSCTGALVEASPLLTVGSDVVLRCGSLEAFGVVVWARIRWCGIAFDEPLDQAEVVSLRFSSDDRSSKDHREVLAAAEHWARGK